MGAAESLECPGCPIGTWCPGQARIILCGMASSGKTQLLERLKVELGAPPGPAPADPAKVGFVVETVTYRKMQFTIWDVGGHGGFQRLHRPYFTGTEALVLVVDSTESEKLSAMHAELRAMLLEDELREAVVLVYANKQDLSGAMRAEKIAQHLELAQTGRAWHVEECSAETGENVVSGLQWLVDALPSHLKRKTCVPAVAHVCCFNRKAA